MVVGEGRGVAGVVGESRRGFGTDARRADRRGGGVKSRRVPEEAAFR